MFVDENNTKSRPEGTYAKVISEIANQGVCPFCPDQLRKFHKLPITEKGHWWITDNMYPYKPTLRHRLLIHKKHISHFSEISPEAWTELQTIGKDEMAKLSIAGGTFVLRFGESRFTGASVTHLHAHIVQSNPDDTEYDKSKGLIMRIG